MGICLDDQQLIRSAISGLPPVAWLSHCQTDDQRQHWEYVRQVHQEIYQHLKAFFGGQQSPKKDKFGELYRLGARRYIHLYNLIFDVWDDLNDAAKLLQLELKSPGELLIQCVELECAAMFFQCLQYTEVSPREFYKRYLDYPKIEKIRVSKNPSKGDLQKLKQFENKLSRVEREFGAFYQMLWFILSVARASKNDDVRQSLKNYFETCDRLDAYINVKFNREATGHKWHRGKVLNLSS